MGGQGGQVVNACGWEGKPLEGRSAACDVDPCSTMKAWQLEQSKICIALARPSPSLPPLLPTCSPSLTPRSPSPGECPFGRWGVAADEFGSSTQRSCSTRRGLGRPPSPMAKEALYMAPSPWLLLRANPSRSEHCCPLIYQPSDPQVYVQSSLPSGTIRGRHINTGNVRLGGAAKIESSEERERSVL